MPVDNHLLIGFWKKTSQSECEFHYPSEVEFLKNGLYKAETAVDEGAIWHGGDWQQEENKQLSIQSANDAMLRYRIDVLTHDSLALSDGLDCRIDYQKIK